MNKFWLIFGSLGNLLFAQRKWFLFPIVAGVLVLVGLLGLAKIAPLASPFLYTLF